MNLIQSLPVLIIQANSTSHKLGADGNGKAAIAWPLERDQEWPCGSGRVDLSFLGANNLIRKCHILKIDPLKESSKFPFWRFWPWYNSFFLDIWISMDFFIFMDLLTLQVWAKSKARQTYRTAFWSQRLLSLRSLKILGNILEVKMWHTYTIIYM